MKEYTYSIGRRKTATAQVKLFIWEWNSHINGKEIQEYIFRSDLFDVLFSPIKEASLKDKIYFEAIVKGSGISAQIQAIRLALARAIAKQYPELRKQLKNAWFLTCDARQVERKKPGKKKARKSPSWSKR